MSRSGVRLLLIILSALGLLTATMFLLLGAWPVLGFSGLELGLTAALLYRNANAVRASEMLLLSADGLRITRVDQAGRRGEMMLSPAWLQVVLEERTGRVPGLLLVARDIHEEVGRALGEAEKRDLADALAKALDRLRHPQFNNAQLQD